MHEGGATRELAPQVVAIPKDLDDGARAAALAEALRTGRAAGDATVIVCGEVNVVRRTPRAGTVNRSRLGRGGCAPPAHAIVDHRDVEGQVEPIGPRSRIVVLDL